MSSLHRGFLDDCEKEQLQFSGAIQAHGALIILSSNLELAHYSENFLTLTGLDPYDFAESVLTKTTLPALFSFSNQIGYRTELFSAIDTEKGSFDLVITRGVQNELNLEFFQHQLDAPEWVSPPDFKGISDLSSLQSLREKLVYWIAEVTGFDRVMYYQFLEGGDGEVIAEVSKGGAHGSYLGLRFPASDIPLIARQLYLKNPWRVIYDAKSEKISLIGETKADLTYSDLRSVSPVHVIYMQNMGDRSSLSFPISAGQELDALISCHSHQPKNLPLKRLADIKDVVNEFNRLLRNAITTHRVRLVDEIAYNTNQMLKSLEMMDEQMSQWQSFSDWLLQEFDVDAVIWSHRQSSFSAGIPFEQPLIEQLERWFTYHCNELVFYKDRIRELISADLLTHIAGAAGLRIRMKDGTNAHLFLLRIEQVDEVIWGGNPNKPVEYHDGVLGIAPRQSFGKWVEKRLGYSRAWESATRLRLLRLRDELQRSSSRNIIWLSVEDSHHE
ncbi:MAG: GAF domain-containing protein [Oceanospirillales bacterium]|nr:MAG: GAF domain-containing protein [Oceanospirillales bacterium]